ncbi:hypothetical protein [Exiguobacterium mexicanum]|uniref:hypothetical protein n=1 Tax=Exiguobacterium mexicanum TaxID=340146 RepID=UPI00384CF550
MVDRITIFKESNKHQAETEELTKQLNDLKKQVEAYSTSQNKQNIDYDYLYRRYSNFVHVEFHGISQSLKDFYGHFKIKHGDKKGLKEETQDLKIISETSITLLLKETEELRHVKGNLSRGSDTE